MFNKKAFIIAFGLTGFFILGFLSSNIYASLNIEKPTNFNNTTDEVPSPNDWIKENQILVYNDRVVLDMKNAEWATFTDTHSMEPVLSSRANAIEIVPKSPDDIKIGDILSYKSKYADGIIIHRVVNKGIDDQGVYFVLKGDNNQAVDPGKIRFGQIQRVLVAIIY